MSTEIKQYPEVGKKYKHYKGGLYEVITLAKHSESDEDLVIYKSIGFGTVYARPLSMWFDDITLSSDTESYKYTLRFSPL